MAFMRTSRSLPSNFSIRDIILAERLVSADDCVVADEGVVVVCAIVGHAINEVKIMTSTVTTAVIARILKTFFSTEGACDTLTSGVGILTSATGTLISTLGASFVFSKEEIASSGFALLAMTCGLFSFCGP